MVAAAGAVGIELGGAYLEADQVFAGRAVGLDAAGRRDVVGGDAVAENRQFARAGHVLHRRRLFRHVLEIGRQREIRRAVLEIVGDAARPLDLAPFGRALEDIAVAPREAVALDGMEDGVGDLAVARPDVLEVDRLLVAAVADPLAREVMSAFTPW